MLCHKDVAGVVSGPTINGEIQSIRLCLEHMHRIDEWAAKQKHATLSTLQRTHLFQLY